MRPGLVGIGVGALGVVCVLGGGVPGAFAQVPPAVSDSQRRAAMAAVPADIVLPSPSERKRASVVLRIRFYADEDYRAGLFRWAERTRGQLEQLNKVVEPAFGIRFDAEGFRRWHRSGADVDVEKLLVELEKMDPGPGVDLVVGFVTPVSLINTSMHQMGAARALGRHIILRGLASADEALAVGKLTEGLDPADREKLQNMRQWHKEAALFLHQWLHTLGALHSRNAERLNHPTYSTRMSNLSVPDVLLASAAVHARLRERQTGTLDWSPLRRTLERESSAEWTPKERDALLAMLPAAAPEPDKKMGEPPKEEGGERLPGGLTREDAEALNQALALTKANKGSEAWALAQPLGARYPKSVDVQRMVCRLAYVRAAGDEGLLACTRAHDMAPTAPEPLIDAAQARILRKEISIALATTDAAAALLKSSTGKPDAWVWVAQLYGQLGHVTRADEALARAGDKAPGLEGARKAVAQDRRIFGLPPGALPAEREPDYADRHRKITTLIDANKLREARTATEAARREFPGVPGIDVLSCEIDARQNRPRPAEKACTQALAAMPDLPRVHYLLGHVKLQMGARDGAIAAFRKSIELDPRESSPWQSLAEVYKATGKRQELATLKTDFQKQFSRPLK
jgi:tetratricopeptide (TPR) repeat protein